VLLFVFFIRNYTKKKTQRNILEDIDGINKHIPPETPLDAPGRHIGVSKRQQAENTSRNYYEKVSKVDIYIDKLQVKILIWNLISLTYGI